MILDHPGMQYRASFFFGQFLIDRIEFFDDENFDSAHSGISENSGKNHFNFPREIMQELDSSQNDTEFQ